MKIFPWLITMRTLAQHFHHITTTNYIRNHQKKKPPPCHHRIPSARTCRNANTKLRTLFRVLFFPRVLPSRRLHTKRPYFLVSFSLFYTTSRCEVIAGSTVIDGDVNRIRCTLPVHSLYASFVVFIM